MPTAIALRAMSSLRSDIVQIGYRQFVEPTLYLAGSIPARLRHNMARLAGLTLALRAMSSLRSDIVQIGYCQFVEPTLYLAGSIPARLRHNMARLAGFEPATLGLEGRCSIQMSYRRMIESICCCAGQLL